MTAPPSPRRGNALRRLILVIIGIAVFLLILQMFGLSPMYQSDKTELKEKPSDRRGEQVEKNAEHTGSEGQMITLLAAYLTGERRLSSQEQQDMLGILSLSQDEITFYKKLSKKRGTPNKSSSWEKMIKKNRSAYWGVKQMIGEVTLNPPERISGEDLSLVQTDGKKRYKLEQILRADGRFAPERINKVFSYPLPNSIAELALQLVD